MSEKASAKKDPLETERGELDLLIGNGMKFTVEYRARKGLFRRKYETVRRTFEIKQPTLAVLDRLSAEWIRIELDEEKLGSATQETLVEAKRIVRENTLRAATITALSVLGEDMFEVRQVGSRISYAVRTGELRRLTRFFLHTVTPSSLYSLAQTITSIANLADFTNSMRLLSGARTTRPTARRESIEKRD